MRFIEQKIMEMRINIAPISRKSMDKSVCEAYINTLLPNQTVVNCRRQA
jgi:hypothetical protein